MTTPTMERPGAGWRPDPSGLAAERWFDGVMWTSRTRDSQPEPASTPTTRAGWYDDPGGSGLLRYFDGSVWTHQVAPRPPVQPASVVAHPSSVDRASSASAFGVAAPQDRRARPGRQVPAQSLDLDGDVDTADGYSDSLLGKLRSLVTARRAGTAMMGVGLIALAYFAWTLGLSSIVADWQQRGLREQLAASAPVTETPAMVTDPAASPAAQASPGASQVAAALTSEAAPKLPANGHPVGTINIPSIGMKQVFVSGTDVNDLKKGPGVWKDGVFPGTPGNATLSGHRTTYGGPFRHIDSLKPGDRITISAEGQPDAVFEVRGKTIVKPSQVAVTYQTPGVRLTLTTCDPVGKDAQRLVVQAELVDGTWASKALPASEWKLQS